MLKHAFVVHLWLGSPSINTTAPSLIGTFPNTLPLHYFNFLNTCGATQWSTQCSKSKYHASQSPSPLTLIRSAHALYALISLGQWCIHFSFIAGKGSTTSCSDYNHHYKFCGLFMLHHRIKWSKNFHGCKRERERWNFHVSAVYGSKK